MLASPAHPRLDTGMPGVRLYEEAKERLSTLVEKEGVVLVFISTQLMNASDSRHCRNKSALESEGSSDSSTYWEVANSTLFLQSDSSGSVDRALVGLDGAYKTF